MRWYFFKSSTINTFFNCTPRRYCATILLTTTDDEIIRNNNIRRACSAAVITTSHWVTLTPIAFETHKLLSHRQIDPVTSCITGNDVTAREPPSVGRSYAGNEWLRRRQLRSIVYITLRVRAEAKISLLYALISVIAPQSSCFIIWIYRVSADECTESPLFSNGFVARLWSTKLLERNKYITLKKDEQRSSKKCSKIVKKLVQNQVGRQ